MPRKKKDYDITFNNFYATIKNEAIELGYKIKHFTKYTDEFKMADKDNIRGRVRTLEALETLRDDINKLFSELRKESNEIPK